MARVFNKEEPTVVRAVLRLERELGESEQLRPEVARLGKLVCAQ